MRFKILGPLEVYSDGGEPVPVRQRLQSSALAVLLLHAGEPCSRGWLMDALWGDSALSGAIRPAPAGQASFPAGGRDGHAAPAARTPAALRTCIYGVRRALAGHDRLLTHPTGYLMRVVAGELDVATWRTLHVRGRAALDRRDAAGAARLLRQALELWRDPPLADLPGTPTIAWEAACLLDQRRDAQDALMDARLALGEHHGVIGQLREIVTADPLREYAWGQLMLALYRSGYQTEAVAAYTKLRLVLAEEYGVDPSPQTQQLLIQILANNPPMAVTPAPVAGGGAAQPERGPVCQLPASLPDFTGRAAEARVLARHLSAPGAAVSVISGLPGVGKTALALQVAQQVRSLFPDGQLYACLGGFGEPRDSQHVLGELLRALGVPPAAIPASGWERTALYRSVLAGRKMLIVADDAASAAQVRPLLPGTPGSAVLVTSRGRLADLDAARVLELGEFAAAEAVSLIGKIVGPARAEAEPGGAAQLAAACGNLPLAVRLAGARLLVRPGMSLSALAASLAQPGRSLSELCVGDQSVADRIAASYRALDAPARRAFRLLPVHGPDEIPGWLVSAMPGGTDSGAADRLAAAGLLSTCGGGDASGARYRVHKLILEYAAGQLTVTQRAESVMALERLYCGWLELADRAASQIARHPHLPALRPVECTVVPAEAAARITADGPAWLEQERMNLLAVTERACSEGRYQLAAELADRQFEFQHRGHRGDAERLWALITRAADQAGDFLAAARARYHRGVLADRSATAQPLLDACIPEFTRAGDAQALADALCLQAYCAETGDDLSRAMASAERALGLARQAGDQRLLSLSLAIRGVVLARTGQVDLGVASCQDGLRLARGQAAPAQETLAWRCLARARRGAQEPVLTGRIRTARPRLTAPAVSAGGELGVSSQVSGDCADVALWRGYLS
jgi:DNA-binding SARP family transcriptional activator